MNPITLTNLVPTTGWAYSDVSYADGVFAFSPGVTAMSQVPMPTPAPGHKYYGRAMQMAPDGLTYDDHRFEWYTGDTTTGLLCFARMVGTGDRWVLDSGVLSLDTPDEGEWSIRNFIVNGSAACYRKELMIVDLTDAFGEGNEPDKAWCDENIPYFTGTITLAEQPEGFSILDATMQAVILLWGAPEDRCRLYRNDALVYEGTDSHYTDAGLIPGLTYTYRLTGYNGSHETAGVSLDAQTRESVLLITDRTATDVASGTRKGRYNATDLIRVGEAMLYAQSLLAQSGFSVSINPKLDWNLDDIPTQAQMERYLTDLRTLRSAMDLIASTPQVPDGMSGLTISRANDIETIIKNIEYTVDHVFAGLFRLSQFDAVTGDRRPIPTANSDMGRTWGELDAMQTTWASWQVASWYLLLYGNMKEEGVV